MWLGNLLQWSGQELDFLKQSDLMLHLILAVPVGMINTKLYYNLLSPRSTFQAAR